MIETFPENDCNYTLSYLDNSADLLNKNSLIIDTRIQRKAAKILYSIRQKYMDHDPRTVTMLRNIAVNARKGFSMLQEKKLDAFAELLSDSWRMVIEVECSTTVEPADILKKLCGKDLIGLKIGGAGGGGFILAIFQDEDKKAFYKQHIQKRLPDSLIYDPVFGVTGLSVYQNVHGQKPESQLYHIGKIKKV